MSFSALHYYRAVLTALQVAESRAKFNLSNNWDRAGGRISQWIAYLLLAQQLRVRFSAFPRFRKILDVVEIYRQRALLRQWTVQSLIVDRTHPVLVRAVLEKKELPRTILKVINQRSWVGIKQQQPLTRKRLRSGSNGGQMEASFNRSFYSRLGAT